MKSRVFGIKQSTFLFFLIATTLVIISYLLIYFSDSLLNNDAAKVEISENAEKLLKETAYRSALVVDGDRESKEDLRNISQQYQESLDLLMNGGRPQKILTKNFKLSQPTDQREIIRLNSLSEAWQQYNNHIQVIINQSIELDSVVENTLKPDVFLDLGDSVDVEIQSETFKRIERVQNPKVAFAYTTLLDSKKDIEKIHDELTTFYRAEYVNAQSNLQVILFFVMLVLLVFLIGGFIYINQRFVKPLDQLTQVTYDIAEGDVTARLNLYDREDEIGLLAQNINTLANSLKRTSEFARSIGQAKFDYPYQARSQKDVLGFALLGMRDNLLQIAEQDRMRNWANEGFNLFINILRSNYKDIQELSYRLISNLVNYLKANQGGLFVVNEERDGYGFLELAASFAYDRRKFTEKRIEIGQGLVGQAVLERDTLHLDRLPEEYLQVSSGLGDASPKNLLIVPLMDNNQVYGALEIASFRKFEQHEIDFVQKLSENIASQLASLKNAESTQRLLEESQIFTKQLKAQEEVMKQNMEALASTQQNMERSQKELERMKESLEIQVKDRTMELQEKEAQLSEALRLAFLAPWKVDITQGIVIGNDELYRLVQTNREIENGYHIPTFAFLEKFVAQEDRALVDRKIKEAIRSKDPNYESTLEFRLKRLTGEERIVALSIKRTPEEDDFERTRFVYGTIQDITRQKFIEEQIRAQKEELEKQQIEQQKFVAMVENATDFVLMVNPGLQIIYANKIGHQMYGIDNYETRPLHLQVLFTDENFKKFIDEVLVAVEANGYWEGELEMYNLLTHQEAFMSGNVVAIRDAKGETSALATIMRDVTDKRRIAQEMESANIRMKTVLDSTEDQIVSIDTGFNILSFNNAWEHYIIEQTSQPPKVGMNLLTDFTLSEQVLEKMKAQFTKAFSEGAYSFEEKNLIIEKQKIKVAGKEKEKEVIIDELYFSHFYNPIFDSESKVVGAVSFTKNVSEQKKAEQVIIRSENRLKAISESTLEGIIIHDKGYVQEINNAFEKISGYKSDEIEGKFLFNFFLPESKATAIINMQLGYDKPFEVIMERKDGTHVPLEMQSRVARFEDLRIRLFAIRDITEQKQAQSKLEQSKDMLQKIIDALPQSVFWKDKDLRFMGCNKQFLKIAGLESTDQIIGKTDNDIWRPEEASIYAYTEKHIVASNMPELDVLQEIIRPDGKNTWLRVSKVPMQNPEGEVIGLIGTYQDITDQKKTEETVLESKERLRKQIETLTILGSREMMEEGLKDFARQINESIAENLDIDRVGVWEYHDEQLYCVDLFQKITGQHSQGLQISLEEHPTFFHTLQTEGSIVSTVAQIDPKVKELTPHYFSPYSITSVLIYPIKGGGKLKGMLACEHTHTPREWSLEEQSFATSMLDLITLKIEESEKVEIERTVEQNILIMEQIIERNKECTLALDANHTVVTFNQKMQALFQHIYGHPLHNGMDWFEIFKNPYDLDRAITDWEEITTQKVPLEKEENYGLGDNKTKIRLTLEPILANDRIIGVAVFARRSGILF